MTQPLVSIMIITYNQVDFVAETLTSAVTQEYENLEVVVADDGSTDGTAVVIQKFAMQYPGLLISITGCQNVGITGNSNRALRRCRGKYIAFQGGDDVLLPGKIAAQVAWFEADEERVLCGHDVDVFDSNTDRTQYRWSDRFSLPSGNGAEPIVQNGVPFCATAIMVRSTVVPDMGFDERLPLVSDWKLWIDCLSSGGKFGLVDGVYARYRRHSRNITNSVPLARFRDILLTLDLVEEAYPHLVYSCRLGRAHQFSALGVAELLQGKRQAAMRLFLTALRHRRSGWKLYAWLLLSLCPDLLIKFVVSRRRMGG